MKSAMCVCADRRLLHESYQGPALEFFKVAVRSWLRSAVSCSGGPVARQFRPSSCCPPYVIEGRQGRTLAEGMRSDFPAWIPLPLESLLTDSLLAGWSDEDRKRFSLNSVATIFNVIRVEPPKSTESRSARHFERHLRLVLPKEWRNATLRQDVSIRHSFTLAAS